MPHRKAAAPVTVGTVDQGRELDQLGSKIGSLAPDPAQKQDRPVYTLEVRPEPDCANPTYAIRRALKALLRHHRLRCVSCSVALRPAVSDQYDAADDLSKSIKLGFEVIRERVRSGGKGWPSD